MRIATVTLLEVGYSARDAGELRAGMREPPVGSMPVEYATPIAEDRAVAGLRCSPTVGITERRRSRI